MNFQRGTRALAGSYVNRRGVRKYVKYVNSQMLLNRLKELRFDGKSIVLAKFPAANAKNSSKFHITLKRDCIK